MSPLAVAVGLLFVLNAGLILVVLALARQVGVLHERVSPIGALALEHGPKVGDTVPALTLPTLSGETIALGAATARSRMLFFLSPTCPVCKKLLPALGALASAERDRLDIVLASDGDRSEHASFAQREKLTLPYVLSAELGMTFRIGKLPYAVLIGPDGIVRAKGLVNNREQLESLLTAEDFGVASMQDYLRRQPAAAA
jgi:methylamine dehydrogenase accessory protein MauD